MQRIITVLIAIFIISAAFGWDSSTRIAVLGIDSRVKGEDVDTAGFSEIIQNTLVNRKVYIVVERAQLYKILEEQKLQASGIAENEASRIGSIAGANKVIIGSLVRIDREYQLLIKVIDSSTGAVEISQEIKGGNIGDIADNIPAAVDMIIKKSMGEGNSDNSGAAVSAIPRHVERAGFFPVQLSFFRGVALVPENFTITGAGFDLIMGYDYAIYGGQFGFFNDAGHVAGAQFGFVNSSGSDIAGAQFGFVNTANNVRGCQIGFVNSAVTLDGVQIGFLNFVKEGWVGFMPIINIGF